MTDVGGGAASGAMEEVLVPGRAMPGIVDLKRVCRLVRIFWRDVLVAGNSLEPRDPISCGKLQERLRVVPGQRQSARGLDNLLATT